MATDELNEVFGDEKAVKNEEKIPEKKKNQTFDSELKAEKDENTKSKRLIPVFVAVAALIGAMFIIVANSSYKQVLNKYFDSIENANGKKYLSIITEYRTAFLLEHHDCDESELVFKCEDMLEDKFKYIDCGEKTKIKYEIRDEERSDKEEVEAVETELNEQLSYLGEDSVKVTDLIELRVDVTVEGDEDEMKFEDYKIYVIKENGKWKLYSSQF